MNQSIEIINRLVSLGEYEPVIIDYLAYAFEHDGMKEIKQADLISVLAKLFGLEPDTTEYCLKKLLRKNIIVEINEYIRLEILRML